MKKSWVGLFFLLILQMPETPLPVIARLNVGQLQSVMQIDFADAPAAAGKIENGWFALDPHGEKMAVINRDNHIVVWNTAGEMIDTYFISGADGLPTTVLDAAFNPEGDVLVSVHAEGGTYYVVYRWVNAGHMEYYRFPTADVPLRVWANAFVWLEVSPIDYLQTRYVLQLNPIVMDRIRINEELSDSEIFQLPSAPENDPDSYLRIGRIDPPLAITITQDGLVKRWDLESGLVTAEAQVGTLAGAGQVTPDGRYFVWRDSESVNLHLLDFETGEDRIVADLNGNYIPFLFVTNTADVVIGVNVDLEPLVVAWDTTTGIRVDLGEYRMCKRQPDMVRLSADNTTLVIGCDSGIDIWSLEAGGG